MNLSIINQIQQLNPWLKNSGVEILNLSKYVHRKQEEFLLNEDWDKFWTILVGPRQVGKTTLGKYLCHQLIAQNRFKELLYLNCDILEIREWLKSPLFVQEAFSQFKLTHPIIFIDEVQRLENPGLLLKSIVDLQLPIKLLASGSSQLEIKSKVQEHLTGRHLEAVVLPFSWSEIEADQVESTFIYGSYPQIVLSTQKQILLTQLYRDYIRKDIIEFLKVGKPDVFEKLVTLIAHSSGQLVNYNQLATDCHITIPTIQHYLDILEKTYVIQSIKPFVGNKRAELTSNPIYYFNDNGFRNQALGNFIALTNRVDAGLLIENEVFQEILKYKMQNFLNFTIHYWRTKSGAEVDFVLFQNTENFIPIEVKYRTLHRAQISRGFRSFIEAYQPKQAIYLTKDFFGNITISECLVHFIPIEYLEKMFEILDGYFKLKQD